MSPFFSLYVDLLVLLGVSSPIWLPLLLCLVMFAMRRSTKLRRGPGLMFWVFLGIAEVGAVILSAGLVVKLYGTDLQVLP